MRALKYHALLIVVLWLQENVEMLLYLFLLVNHQHWQGIVAMNPKNKSAFALNQYSKRANKFLSAFNKVSVNLASIKYDTGTGATLSRAKRELYLF